MQFRILAGFNDGITFPHHQIQMPGSFSLIPKNRIHFILLLTIGHHQRRLSLLPFEFPRPVETVQIPDIKDKMDLLGVDPIHTPSEKSPW